MEKETPQLSSDSTSSPVAQNPSEKRAALVANKRKRKGSSCCTRVSRRRPRSLGEALAEGRLRTTENKSISLIVDGGEGDNPCSWSVLAAGEKETRVMPVPPLPSDFPVCWSGFSGNGSCIYVLGGQKSVSLMGKSCRDVFYFNFECPREGWKRLPSFNTPRCGPLVITTDDGTMYAMGAGIYSGQGQSWAEALEPDSYQWKTLPQLPPELSEVRIVTMHAVFDSGQRILLYSPILKTAFTFDVGQNSWTLLDAGFGVWWGEAAVIDDIMFCYGSLDGYDYSSFSVRAYDLKKQKWFPRPVRGLEGEGVLPPVSSLASGGELDCINMVHLVRISSRRLCLIWAEHTHDNGHAQLKVHCTKFTIHERVNKRKHEIHFDARNLFRADYVVDGYDILCCMLITHMDPLQSNNEEDTGPLTMEPTSQNRKGRGPTYMPQSIGVRQVVEYNSKNQPIGKVATKMTSYLGVLGRTMVPIIHDNWHKVPTELKNELWSCVEMRYIVDPKRKKNILSSIGNKWKSFKNSLTTKYIIPFKDQPELLRYPPEIYNFIEQGHWNSFVTTRLSEEFQKISQIQKERRAKNIYNHRLSRKGYAGLEEEYKRTLGTTEELDRSVLWKKARQNKKGEYEDEIVRECVEKIDELTKQTQDGIVSTERGTDVLTMALGTPEHPGRLRGVGHFITLKSYFHIPKREHEFEVKQKVMELQLQSLQSELKSLKEQGLFERANSNYPKSDVHPRSKEEVMKPKKEISKGKPCSLALGPKKNNPGELTTVKDAVGFHVAWPKDLVLPTSDEGSSKQEQSSPMNPLAQASIDNPPIIKFLIKYVERVMVNDYVNITLENGIFGQKISTFLLKEDIKFLCQMQELSNMCIVIYISHLYQVLKKSNLEEKYGFVNPTTISSANPNGKGSRVLADRLEVARRNQLFFVPFNHGFHWILIVIDPSSMTAYYLDPLRHEIHSDIRNVINTGLKMFHAQIGKKIRKNLVWTKIECPKQPTNVECGYYVMRYMKDLIDDQSLPITQMFNGKNTYTQAEIDEVRSEWAIAVQEYV